MIAVIKENWPSIATFAVCMVILVVANLFARIWGVTIVNIVVWTCLACFATMFASIVRKKVRCDDYELIM